MNHWKKILAVFTAVLMALSMTACLVSKDEAARATDAPADPQTDAPATDAPIATDDFDGDAIAVELGDITITANEVANVFDSYISMFTYYGTIDRETVNQCFAMVEDELVRYYLPLWKAHELGLSLSDEEAAEIDEKTRSSVEEERNALLCQFAYYYGATEDIYEDESQLTEEERSIALDGINEQLAEMFYEGFEFDDYLEMEYDSIYESYEIDLLTEQLKATQIGTELTDEQIEEWYQGTLSEQQTRYTETPSEYYYDVSDYADGLSETPVLYTPAGYARVQVIEYIPDGDPDPAIEENRKQMNALEAEYGALLLNGGDEARKTEIETEYAALKADTEALEAAYYSAVRASIEEAYAKLQNGEAFEDVSAASGAGDEPDERLVYTAGVDARNGGIAEIAKTLEVGAYSEPQIADDAYVIVKLIEVLPEGPVDRAAIAEQIGTAAAAALKEELWEAQFDAWLTEAKEVAVFHRETYEMIGDSYLYE